MTAEIEPFINADQAAEFLSWNRLRVVREARKGNLPAHSYPRGRGHDWFFRKSELANFMLTNVQCQPRPFALESRSE
jgi:hypothetical protein